MSPTTAPRPASTQAPGVGRGALALRWMAPLLALFLASAATLFLTGGTWHYREAQLFLAAFFLPATALSIGFLLRSPAVLERRLNGRTRSRTQRALVTWFRPLFILAFCLPGLDHRFHWSDRDVETVPLALALAADGVIVIGILFAGWVMRINAYAGNLLRTESGQPLITNGPYSLIRHPLYAASLIVWMAMPVALGSWVALPAFLLVTPFYALRLRSDEATLKNTLPGYALYMKRTPFRLVPFVW